MAKERARVERFRNFLSFGGDAAAQAGTGMIPVYAQYQDGRDIMRAIMDMGNGNWKTGGAWFSLGMAVVAIVPGMDWVKGGRKSLKNVDDAADFNGATNKLDEAYHYTAAKWGDAIKKDGLRPGSYGTPAGDLSPLQAKLELALPPTRAAPEIKIRIDLEGLRKAGYEIPNPTRVGPTVPGPDGRIYQMPGGGYEMQFPYEIPGEFLEVLPIK